MCFKVFNIFFTFALLSQSISAQDSTVFFKTNATVINGAERFNEYENILREENVAIVANQSSVINESLHLVDFLLEKDINILRVFSPEHGFRGKADAGAHIKDQRDAKTGLKLISLYGKSKKPSYDHLADVNVVVLDLQDVGVRFYTYISTMHYVMIACAEMKIKVVVLDRPNPNGFYVDGPILEPDFQSFVGMHRVPLVHGMTIGEYAKMINEEGWLGNGVKCDLTVIPCLNYDHNDYYKLSIKPSPNLPNSASVFLYPSLALFEGTVVSVGRGTETPFQIIGHPNLKDGDLEFTPTSRPGAKSPKLISQKCTGYHLKSFGESILPVRKQLYLFWLLNMYKEINSEETPFFLENGFFDLLAGTDKLRMQIESGLKEDEIRESWQEGLVEFKKIRKKYLLYSDFE
ncbi:MAG: DUF1343 domain-containing protein [Salibacteraceae bacterium]|nr:DUF1343 domain-containing protein [Salibacteraceae bacterium]